MFLFLAKSDLIFCDHAQLTKKSCCAKEETKNERKKINQKFPFQNSSKFFIFFTETLMLNNTCFCKARKE